MKRKGSGSNMEAVTLLLGNEELRKKKENRTEKEVNIITYHYKVEKKEQYIKQIKKSTYIFSQHVKIGNKEKVSCWLSKETLNKIHKFCYQIIKMFLSIIYLKQRGRELLGTREKVEELKGHAGETLKKVKTVMVLRRCR